MGGKVQMVYIDPPYGIRYGSNFQPFVNQKDVSRSDRDQDLTCRGRRQNTPLWRRKVVPPR